MDQERKDGYTYSAEEDRYTVLLRELERNQKLIAYWRNSAISLIEERASA